MSNIIHDYETLINDIYDEYKSSKSLFKKKKKEKRLSEINTMINRLTNNQSIISTKIISDYAKEISNIGKIGNCCKALTNLDNNGVAIFDIRVNDAESIVVTISPMEKDPSVSFINYSYRVEDDIVYSFMEENVKYIVHVGGVENTDGIEGKFNFIKDYSAQVIISDIDKYLKNFMKGNNNDK